MKYSNTPLLLLVLAVLLSLSSFSSSEQLLPTKLRITVLDGLGNPVEAAQVTLYTSEEDYKKNENDIGSCQTDKKGRALFKDLKPMSYYIDARSGDMNNNGEGVQTAVLQEGKLNTVNTIIQ